MLYNKIIILSYFIDEKIYESDIVENNNSYFFGNKHLAQADHLSGLDLLYKIILMVVDYN